MPKRTPEEERRVVPKKTKMAIIAFFILCTVLVVWYKIPYERTYTAELMRREAGETEMYGEFIDVEIRVKVQRHFFHDTVHTGTVTVNGDRYATPEKIEKVPDLLHMAGDFLDTDTFTLMCSEWHGDYLVNRCIAAVSDGVIVNVYLLDDTGVYAGQYGPMPKNSQ